MAEPAPLVISALSVSATAQHGRPTRILNDVSLRVDAGTSVGLIGESGSGKSVTVRASLGLLPQQLSIQSGSVILDGIDLHNSTARTARHTRALRVGYVPQDPLASLNPVLRVGEQITEQSRLFGTRRRRTSAAREIGRAYGIRTGNRQVFREAGAMLEQVHIPDPLNRARQYPHEFSGGMRQRAIIASALSLNPPLVIADEPTTALDASVERGVLDLLREQTVGAGRALLLVTHDLAVVSWYCDMIYVLHDGHVVESGPVERVFTHPRHAYTIDLIESLASGEVS